AAVVAVSDERGHARLVGYVVPAAGAGRPVPAALRQALSLTLPRHLVPAAFVVLDALPLTVSGKLDRRALPAPDPDAAAGEREFTAPRTEAERELAGIWSAVLGVAHVGVDDNFFELGGDSILGIQTVSRARAAGLHVTSRDVFRHQTVAELAAAADRRAAPPVTTAPQREAGPGPLAPIQEWFLATHGPLRHFTMSMLLDLPPETDPDALERALRALTAHHPALRTRFARE
ncbi:phosphopantetheine-binding protein, partial [Streptomyces sp. AC627_RSS907]